MVDITKEVCSEVYDIIQHMKKELVNKIPNSFINLIKQNRDENFIVNIDYSRRINEQELQRGTRVILSLIYRDYLCSKEQREELIKKDQEELKIIEKELREKYNPDNLFKKEKIKREAVVFETGGIRPTNELGESWIGRVCWQYPGETLPISESGNPMIPIATIFIENLEYIPESFKNVKMLNIFMDEDIWNNIGSEDYNKWFKINIYNDLESLVSCDYKSDNLKAFPLVPKYVNNDFPQWDDIDEDLCDIICEMEDNEGISYYDDIYEENYFGHKIGGHPSSIQGGVGFDEGYEYVLQITSDSKANFNIVDSGNFYFAYNPNSNMWSVRCDFY